MQAQSLIDVHIPPEKRQVHSTGLLFLDSGFKHVSIGSYRKASMMTIARIYSVLQLTCQLQVLKHRARRVHFHLQLYEATV